MPARLGRPQEVGDVQQGPEHPLRELPHGWVQMPVALVALGVPLALVPRSAA
jgi:hypothetical protein